jgi:hypothetical protein
VVGFKKVEEAGSCLVVIALWFLYSYTSFELRWRKKEYIYMSVEIQRTVHENFTVDLLENGIETDWRPTP